MCTLHAFAKASRIPKVKVDPMSYMFCIKRQLLAKRDSSLNDKAGEEWEKGKYFCLFQEDLKAYMAFVDIANLVFSWQTRDSFLVIIFV